MRLFGHHGVYPGERESGRVFEVDAELYFPFAKAAASDDLADTVDYARVCQVIGEAFNKAAYNLLETAASRVAEEVLARFPVEKVVISVRKPDPPVEGHMEYAEVQVCRSR